MNQLGFLLGPLCIATSMAGSWVGSACSGFPNEQCLSSTFPLSINAVGFWWSLNEVLSGFTVSLCLPLLLSGLVSLHSSTVTDCFCKQYASALSVILSYQYNKRKAGPYGLWGDTGPSSCRSPSNQVTSFTLIMIISHFSKTPCCQTPVIMSPSVHQCTPNSI